MANSNKVFDLAFYKGITNANRILYTNEIANAVCYDKAIYPFPEFVQDVNLLPLDVSVVGTQISRKIQNNNLIIADGTPKEALLLIGIPSISGVTITIDMNVAFKPVGGEIGDYGYFTFSFSYTGQAVTGTIKGLTAFGITFSNTTDTHYVGFVGGVASYNYTMGAAPTEGVLVTIGDLVLKDLAVDNTTELIYFITANSLYSLNFGTQTITPINIEGKTGASNFVSVATDDTYVYIAATLNSESYIIIYEIATGDIFEERSPFSDKTIPFNRIKWERGIDNYAGVPKNFVICSNGAGAAFSSGWNGTSFPNLQIVDSAAQPALLVDEITDVSQLTLIEIGIGVPNGTIGIAIATIAGWVSAEMEQGLDNVFIIPPIVPPPPPFTQFQNQSNILQIEVTSGDSITGVMDEMHVVVARTNSSGNFYDVVNWVAAQIVILNTFDTITQSTALNTKRVNNLVDYWLGAILGRGIRSQQSNNAVAGGLLTISDNYDLVLRDIIKYDINNYYFLVNEIGSSNIDANAVLLSYDSSLPELQGGLPGYFLPTDKLWLAGDVFLLRNLEEQNSFYYKVTNNLNLNETSGSSAASQNEGLINTTEAGNVVDIIYSRGLFYLLGSRGIEVWQNQGASGFPYRKESYLTIPYHLLPLSDQNLYRFQLNRWSYFQGGYAISVLSNEDNEYQILIAKDGKYQLLPLNKAAWHAALNQIGSEAQDLALDVVNMWGEEYIIISKINSRTIGTRAGAIIISSAGQLSILPTPTLFAQESFLTTTSTNGLRSSYESSVEELVLSSAVQFPSNLNVLLMNLESQLLKPYAENVLVKTLVIQYAFPIEDVANYPLAATFSIRWSADEGRNFDQALVVDELWSNHLTTRQLIYQINATVPSFMLQFSSNRPIIIQSAIVTYQETGLR